MPIISKRKEDKAFMGLGLLHLKKNAVSRLRVAHCCTGLPWKSAPLRPSKPCDSDRKISNEARETRRNYDHFNDTLIPMNVFDNSLERALKTLELPE